MFTIQLPPPTFVWADAFGSNVPGPEQQQGYRTIVDKAGNVLTIGQFENATQFKTVSTLLTLTPPVNPGKGDIFITKHDAQGGLRWVKQFGGAQRDLGWDIQLDRRGNILHSGSFDDTVDFDPGVGTLNLSVPNFTTTSAARRSGYLSKLDPSGNVLWAVQIASGLDQPVRIGGNVANNKIGTDGADNIYVSGYFQSNRKTDFNWLVNQGAPGESVLGNDATGTTNAAFVAKYDRDGKFKWVRQQGGNRNTQANAIAVDVFGNVYTVGTFRGTEDFDPGPDVVNLSSSSNTDADIYISKLNAAGQLIWVKQLGSSGSDEANDIKLDRQGNVHIIGNFTGNNFRYNPNNPNNTYNSIDAKKDIFVTKLSKNGDLIWSKSIGGVENQDALTLEVDILGNLYIGGEFRGNVDFDPGTGVSQLSSTTSISSFIVKLNAKGDFQWTLPLNGNGATLSLNDIAIDFLGRSIAGTGYFSNAAADLNPGAGIFNPKFTEARDAFVVNLRSPLQWSRINNKLTH